MAVPGNLAAGGVVVGAGRGNSSGYAQINVVQGIYIGGPSSVIGDNTWTRHLAVGVSKSAAIGNPTPPCIAIAGPGFWRFRWCLSAGVHSISCAVLQASGLTPRPSMVIKKNTAIGVAADVPLVAVANTGWTTIGPVSFSVTPAGVVWVELWNNLVGRYDTAYFDHIVTT